MALLFLIADWTQYSRAEGPQVFERDERCEMVRPAQMVCSGASDRLLKCLDYLEVDGALHALRITSAGGETGRTLLTAKRLIGKLDVLIVDKLCASSCANYLVPAASKLMVNPNSYVILHGSVNP